MIRDTDDVATAANGDAQPESRTTFDVIEGGLDPIKRLGIAIELLRRAADMGLYIHLDVFKNGERRLELRAHLCDCTLDMIQQLRSYERELATVIELTSRFPCFMQHGSPSSAKTQRYRSVDDEFDDIPF
jgi:hypothetical protein